MCASRNCSINKFDFIPNIENGLASLDMFSVQTSELGSQILKTIITHTLAYIIGNFCLYQQMNQHLRNILISEGRACELDSILPEYANLNRWRQLFCFSSRQLVRNFIDTQITPNKVKLLIPFQIIFKC